MPKYKISVTDACIGCQACVNVCDNFSMNDDNKAEPANKEVKEIGCNKDAADACPVNAIQIEEV